MNVSKVAKKGLLLT